MHESERNRLQKRRRALLLAASDMVQAEAAARALQAEHGNLPVMRALETAIGVCYARAFTQSSLLTLTPDDVPTDAPDSDLHTYLRELRDKVYAHTDKDSGRTSSIKAEATESPDFLLLKWHEEWNAFPRDSIPQAIELFHRQRDRFLDEALTIGQQLDEY